MAYLLFVQLVSISVMNTDTPGLAFSKHSCQGAKVQELTVCVCVCVCACVVSVIVKRPVLPLCVVDGHSRNPLYYYYYYELVKTYC